MIAPAPATTYTSSSLYVGELAPDVSEARLYDIFNTVGPVASIRVCRDAMLKRSLGYAYVNFHNQSDAERALETMNYTVINNRPCRIMWSQRDPSLRKSGVGNIFVKSLHPNVHHKELQDTFSLFGNILSCKVALDVEGKSKGYGYVHFETEEAAKAAIDRMGEIEILGTKVEVQAFQKKTNPQRTVAWTNLYAKNVPAHMSESDLHAMFSKFGEVVSLKLMVFGDDECAKDAASTKPRGIKSGSSKGFAFINYGTHEHALAAAEGLNGLKLADPESVKARHMAKARVDAGEAGDAPEQEAPTKLLYVGRAQKREERQRELKKVFQQLREKNLQSLMGVNLFVKNLDDTMDDKGLDAAFKVYGNITSSRVMRGLDGASKGFGFVCFSTPEEATLASNEMNGKVLNGKPVYVALAQRRDQRREMLSQMQIAPRGPPGGGPRGPMPGNMYGALPMQMFPQHNMGNRGYNNMIPMMGGKGMPRGQMGYQQQQRMPQYSMQQYQQGGPMQQMGQGQQMQGQQRRGGPRQGGDNRRGPGMPQQQHPGMQQQQMPMMGNNGQPGGPQGQPRGMRQPMQGPPQQQRQQMQQPQQQQPNVQFNAKVRNQPPANATGPAPAIAEPPSSGGPAPLTTSMLAAADEGTQKNMIGERLYPLIANTQSELAGKITGMLLEMDNAELLHLLESSEALDSKINEALEVLRAHQISSN